MVCLDGGVAGRRIRRQHRPRSDPGSSVADTSFESSIQAIAGARTPNLNILLDTRFNFTVFVNEDQLNSNDQFITLGSDYQYGRSRWGVQGDFVNDTTRTSDIDNTGLFILDNMRRTDLPGRADMVLSDEPAR